MGLWKLLLPGPLTVRVSAGYTTKVEPNRGPEPPKKQNEDQGKAWDKKRLWFEGSLARCHLLSRRTGNPRAW